MTLPDGGGKTTTMTNPIEIASKIYEAQKARLVGVKIPVGTSCTVEVFTADGGQIGLRWETEGKGQRDTAALPESDILEEIISEIL